MMGVELREIEVFLTLAEQLHFGRTAERLGLTPSRISQIVRTLETRVGGALFDRTSRRVRLTPLGEHLQREIGPLYEAIEAVMANVREVALGVAGTLRLGMYTPISGGPHLVEIIKAFEARYPSCRVEVVETGIATDQLDWLHREALDLMATRFPIDDPELTIGPLLSREERVLVVAADHPLARRDSVSVEDLGDYVLPDVPTMPRETMAAFVPSTTPAGRPIRRRTVRSISEVVTLVARGETIHPTVTSFLHHHRHPGIVSVPLTGLPPSESGLVWLTRHRTTKVAAFAETAAKVIDAHGGP
jgi:DNA-binding transcriptional LysR family regulator